MLRLGLIGAPVGHSLSPRIFEWLGAHLRRPIDYVPHHVEPAELADFLRSASRRLDGFNVTAPHKRAVFEACTSLTPEARAAGAVNAVRVGPDGTLVGHNTDIAGFRSSLGTHRPRRAAILGAGGAARAVGVALRDLGVADLVVLARRPDEAAAVVRLLGVGAFAALSGSELLRAFEGADLIVQATPAPGPIAALGLPWDHVAPDALATDLVYRPVRTPFLDSATRAGVRTVDGLEMLGAQAVGALVHFAPAWAGSVSPDRGPEIARFLRAGPD